MTTLAEQLIDVLVGSIYEDKIDGLVQKYGRNIPGETPQEKRNTVVGWSNYDPSRSKKYLPWFIKLWMDRKIPSLDSHTLDHIRDMLMDFEHYQGIGGFPGSRDIYSYDLASLEDVISQSRDLALVSRSEKRKGKSKAPSAPTGGEVVSELGPLRVVAFKDGEALAEEAWRAYSPDNPNWTGKPLLKTDPAYAQGREPYHVDHKWCIREPQRGFGYIRAIPDKNFYVVEKGGWPYVGAVLGNAGSQIHDLDNQQISSGMADEIYDVLKPILKTYSDNGWPHGPAADKAFGSLRIVRGEVSDGETVGGQDLSGSRLSKLPSNLTVTGALNVSNTQLTALPPGLTVQGELNISGTAVSELPADLKVSGSINASNTGITVIPSTLVTSSLDISGTQVSELPEGLQVTKILNISNTNITTLPKSLVAEKVIYSPDRIDDKEVRTAFFYMRRADMRKHFWSEKEHEGKTDEQKNELWETSFAPRLLNWFQTAPQIVGAMRVVFQPDKGAKA